MARDGIRSSSERRGSTRIRVNEVVQFEIGGRRVVGLLSVINENGFFVTTRHFLELGSEADFELEIPEAGRFLHVRGEIVLINGPEKYDRRMSIGMGVRFLQMDQVTERIIGAFLNRSSGAYVSP